MKAFATIILFSLLSSAMAKENVWEPLVIQKVIRPDPPSAEDFNSHKSAAYKFCSETGMKKEYHAVLFGQYPIEGQLMLLEVKRRRKEITEEEFKKTSTSQKLAFARSMGSTFSDYPRYQQLLNQARFEENRMDRIKTSVRLKGSSDHPQVKEVIGQIGDEEIEKVFGKLWTPKPKANIRVDDMVYLLPGLDTEKYIAEPLRNIQHEIQNYKLTHQPVDPMELNALKLMWREPLFRRQAKAVGIIVEHPRARGPEPDWWNGWNGTPWRPMRTRQRGPARKPSNNRRSYQ